MKCNNRIIIGTLLLTIFLVSIVTPASAYSYSGNKWGTKYAKYTLDSSIPSGWSTQIAKGATAWNNAGANFYFYTVGCNNKLSYTSIEGEDAARTYRTLSGSTLVGCTTSFNNRMHWSTADTCPNYRIDVRSVATHEFGHWLRLKDVNGLFDTEKTMYGGIDLGETKKRSLHSDDIAGIKAIYP